MQVVAEKECAVSHDLMPYGYVMANRSAAEWSCHVNDA